MSEEEQTAIQREAERIFASKKTWHKRQSKLPSKKKCVSCSRYSKMIIRSSYNGGY